ncbi:MAG: AAA family ATPase [Veillonella sp.]|uniref:AAA family ATPase n=1 Tax=Veillonella sp. TaxID=1926307 RepID=UPI001D7AD982|nr:AAA family ATPase [Veillonella sp.]MBS6186167.1 AAA family ATPase [Veillonella sp.]MDU5401134.1 AAA family ATPase [Veillonella sp.]
MGDIDNLTTEERVSYLIKPILEVLSQSSSSLTTAELRSQIIKMDPYIAEYAEAVYTSEKTGIPYKDFTKRFSLAIKELEVLGILSREGKGRNSRILLTPKGQELDISTLNVEKDIRARAQVYWKERRKKITRKKTKAANVAKNEKRLLWRATANFKESGFSWYQLEVGDVVTYNYATEKNIEIGRFGLGYNKDSGKGSNQPAGSIVCVFQIVDYLMLPDSQTNKAVLRCVHKFDNPISLSEINSWFNDGSSLNLQGGLASISDTQADIIINKFESIIPELSPFIKSSKIFLPIDQREHPLQIMLYGAPGTGKSYSISSKIRQSYPGFNECDDNPYVFRTTIYRDYSYFDFIGNIMPVTKDGKISYEFVPGIFTSALFAALRNQDSGIDVYLILEEMSRGDIASIFGDIFQLLDRDDTGKSMYGINNKSIYEYLILNRALKPGYKIVIPKNLHIIGTVNTSDQNVNVIDTAFKRRFDFKYVGVEPKSNNNGYVNNFSINFTSDNQYEWVKLYQAINHVIINDLGLAEDKQLGPFFLKDKGNDALNRKQVANKLLHYLWQDVERVSYTSGSLFADGITSFSQLYYAFKKKENILSKSVIEQYGKL